ncbi:hypothetical protein MAR_026299, partial [Mya arenaria]
DVWRCRYCLSETPDVDVHPSTDWLLNEAEIKVLVIHVIDASHFFVRVLGVRVPEGDEMEDLLADFSELQMNLALWYTGARIGEICGYQENEIFFRVQVLQLIEQGSHEKGAATTDAEIMFIDSGRIEQIPVVKLYKLPEDLKAVTVQHLERLFKMIQWKVNIPRALMIKTKMSQELLTDVISACRPSHKVVISSVHTP